ncbi:hypothetical protein N7499_004704 [Penicillium canescens]|nr:hypothetical protein N7499_004704 [Penicillium canescens]KAJ6161861.1 hypothetical protein N7485_010091 [Penicillium canescens]
MSSTVTRIIEAFNAPEPTTKTAWEVTEAEMEIALPNDYKELIDRMGGGYIEKYMYILEPNCRNEHYDLLYITDERTEAKATIFVIPWATTDNGEYLFWRCLPGQHPDEWTVILNQGRDWTWEHHEMNCTDFLYAALTKEIQSEILSDDFPLSRHVFASFNPAPSHSIRLTGIRRPKRRLKQ